jgi:hypothetical protein
MGWVEMGRQGGGRKEPRGRQMERRVGGSAGRGRADSARFDGSGALQPKR